MTQIVCANCGQALRPTDKFCYNCGAKVQPIKMKPEVEKAVPKPTQAKTAPSVLKQQIPQRPEVPEKVQEVVPEKAPEERPKFHMDEAMSWNTDGYPEAQRHPVQNPEEADFAWSDSTAQDRIKKRQEEGRRALYEEQEARQAAKEKAEAEAAEQFAGTPEAEEVVKAVDSESTVPVDSFKEEYQAAVSQPEEVPAAPEFEFPKEPETPEAVEFELPKEPEVPEAPAPVEAELPEEPAAPEVTEVELPKEPEAPVAEAAPAEAPVEPAAAPEPAFEPAPAEPAPAEPEPEKVPAPSFRDVYQAEVDGTVSAEADDDYVVPTIESIEKDAEEAKARQAEKDIFGYTLDDIDSGARPAASGGAQVIDKFYTYSKKQEEFQALLDQENEKLKGGRTDAQKPQSSIQEELDKAIGSVEEKAPEKPVETGGFVGVQLPETPESVVAYARPEAPEAEAVKEPEPVIPAETEAAPVSMEDAYKAPSMEDAYKAPKAEEPAEFLGGNFGKADDITRNAEAQASEDKSAAANTVAAAAGAVAAGAAAIAAAREKARAKIEAEKEAEAVSAAEPEAPAVTEAELPKEPEAPAAVEEAVSETVPEVAAEEAPAQEEAPEKLFDEVITEESEKVREKSLAEAAEEAAIAKAAEIKAEEEAAAAEAKDTKEAEVPLEEAQKSIDAVVEETAAPVEEEVKEEQEDDHKLTYQDVFNEETEKTPKHTFLKVLAILILILIILEVAAILIRRFAPDSAIGLQIQQIYEMIFSRFL